MPTKKKFIYLIITGLLILNGSAIALYSIYLSHTERSNDLSVPTVTGSSKTEVNAATGIAALSDEYYSIHFNYSDAVEVCKLEARSRNSSLIQLSVNDLSSRFNPRNKMYLIKLDSHVGTPLHYDEKAHTCHIDPQTQGVAFYQEITRRTAIRPTP